MGGKVRRIAAEASPEHVFEDSKRVLDAIAASDWQTYTELCEEDMSCFEEEAVGHRVDGLAFHQFYFENGNSLGGAHQSNIVDEKVRLLGESHDVAVITYTRLVQRETKEGFSTRAVNETRVWRRQAGKWRHVHFHRSDAVAQPQLI